MPCYSDETFNLCVAKHLKELMQFESCHKHEVTKYEKPRHEHFSVTIRHERAYQSSHVYDNLTLSQHLMVCGRRFERAVDVINNCVIIIICTCIQM